MTQDKKKERLDQLLVEAGHAPSRAKAAALILTGDVLVDEVPISKAGTKVRRDAKIRLRNRPSPYVSRGGEKISTAFDHFNIQLDGVVSLDVGASTGGFTDCMLSRGAALVYAVDVGYNQLARSLREDSRVVVMEKINAKELRAELFTPAPTFASIDVSFISVRKIFDSVTSVLADPKHLLILVKPQFELGREYIQKGGVVRDEKDQVLAVNLVKDYAEGKGFEAMGSIPSPLKGEKKGNQEYFLYLRKC